MDFPIEAAALLASLLQDLGLREDFPQDLARPVHSTTSAELIQPLKRADPGLQLYAAFDPYHGRLRAEIKIVYEKIPDGASSLFAQPFFDLRYLEVCTETSCRRPRYSGRGALRFLV